MNGEQYIKYLWYKTHLEMKTNKSSKLKNKMMLLDQISEEVDLTFFTEDHLKCICNLKENEIKLIIGLLTNVKSVSSDTE